MHIYYLITAYLNVQVKSLSVRSPHQSLKNTVHTLKEFNS